MKSKYISRPILYVCLAAVVLILFYELWRLILLILSDDVSSQVPAGVLARSFLVGLRFDFAIASYIMLVMSILAVIPFFDIERNRKVRTVHTWLLTILVGVTFFVHLADIEFFKYFNVRLNGVATQWGDTPEIMLSLIWNTYPVIRYFILYTVVLAAFVFVIRWLQKKFLNRREYSPFWINLIFLPAVLLIFFIGARGRIEKLTTLRWGIAYFSEYDFANQLALNPNYTFMYDALYSANKKEDVRHFVEELSRPDADRVVRDLVGIPYTDTGDLKGKIHRRITFDSPHPDPPNVILIIMESFGATKIDVMNNLYNIELSPHFDSLTEEGTLFTNMYSEGQHTYSGIFTSLYGYPHLLGKFLMKQVRGEHHIWGLPSIFKDYDYETLFCLTHDPHFDNIQGFMMSNGYKHVISSLDYDEDLQISTWGVPDHVMFERAIDEIHKLGDKKFFLTLLTASNHGPWIVPDVPYERVLPGMPNEMILNAFKYSDWALGTFIRKVQNDPAFANTLIVIGADNGAGGKKRIDLDLTYYHIPLLILDTGGEIEKGKKINHLASQMDILSTVMGLVRLDYDNYSFGRDLLDTTSSATHFAYLSEWYRIGYIENDYYFIARQRGRGPESLYRLPDYVDMADSLPDLLKEYEKKAFSIFQVGYYNLYRPLVKEDADKSHMAESP